MHIDNLFCDGEPETGSSMLAATRCICTIERNEDRSKILVTNAETVVIHENMANLQCLLDPHLHGRASELDRVLDKIGDCPPQIRAARYATMSDIQAAFPKAKVLDGERVRFPIAGGDDRLVVAFDLEKQIAFIKFFGTHAEYDKVNALTVSRY